MFPNRLIFILFLYVLSTNCVSAQNLSEADSSSKITNHIFKLLATRFPKNSEIAVAILDGDSTSYLGFRRGKKEWINVDNQDAVFEIGSVTKVFTSTLLAHAIAEGIVKANDPISGSVPVKINRAEKNGKAITYQMLANHTSGLPRLPPNLNRTLILNSVITKVIWPFLKKNGNPYKGYRQKNLNRYLKSGLKPRTTPGEVLRYSNLGAGLLGQLLEYKTGYPFEDLLQTKIMKPYRMSSTTTKRELISEQLVVGRYINGDKAKNWDMDAMQGAGALLSSVRDLGYFATANFQMDSLLAITHKKTFSVTPQREIALGWFIVHTESGQQFYWHNGGTGGYSSSMGVNVASKQAVIILTNVARKNKSIDAACFALMNALEKGK